MPLVDNLDSHSGFLVPTEFDVVLPGFCISLGAFVQNVQIPSVSSGEAIFSNPINPSAVTLPGDTFSLNPLEISFALDRKLVLYEFMYTWLKACSYPDDVDNYNYFVNTYLDRHNHSIDQVPATRETNHRFKYLMHDISVTAKSEGDPFTSWKFHNCFPVSVDGFRFDSTIIEDTPLQIGVSFKYSNMYLVPTGSSRPIT